MGKKVTEVDLSHHLKFMRGSLVYHVQLGLGKVMEKDNHKIGVSFLFYDYLMFIRDDMLEPVIITKEGRTIINGFAKMCRVNRMPVGCPGFDEYAKEQEQEGNDGA